MKIEFDTKIEEWVACFPDHPQIGECYGDTYAQAQAAGYEALRVWSAHAQRNTWTPIAPGVFEVKSTAH